jgi:hypothetical protein
MTATRNRPASFCERPARPIIVSSASSTGLMTTGASWYARWLINLPGLPALLEATPVRSELIYLLVTPDKRSPR